jgi:hypothetical protein
MKLFRWLKKDGIESPMVWLVTEEMIQGEAEQEIDRKLTDTELTQLVDFQYFDDEFSWTRMVLIRSAIRKIVFGKGGDEDK